MNLEIIKKTKQFTRDCINSPLSLSFWISCSCPMKSSSHFFHFTILEWKIALSHFSQWKLPFILFTLSHYQRHLEYLMPPMCSYLPIFGNLYNVARDRNQIDRSCFNYRVFPSNRLLKNRHYSEMEQYTNINRINLYTVFTHFM